MAVGSAHGRISCNLILLVVACLKNSHFATTCTKPCTYLCKPVGHCSVIKHWLTSYYIPKDRSFPNNWITVLVKGRPMSAKRLICAVNSSSEAAYTIVDLPILFSILPELVWLCRIRRVLFQNDFLQWHLFVKVFFYYFFLYKFCYIFQLILIFVLLICLTKANGVLIRSITVCTSIETFTMFWD